MKALYFIVYSISDIFDSGFDSGSDFGHDANDDNDLDFFCFYYDCDPCGHDADDCFYARYVLSWKNDRMIDLSMVAVLEVPAVLGVLAVLVLPVLFVLRVVFVTMVLGERFEKSDKFVHHENHVGSERVEKPQTSLQYQIPWLSLRASLTGDQEHSSSTSNTTIFSTRLSMRRLMSASAFSSKITNPPYTSTTHSFLHEQSYREAACSALSLRQDHKQLVE